MSIKRVNLRVFAVAQQVKDPVFSLQWLGSLLRWGFDLWCTGLSIHFPAAVAYVPTVAQIQLLVQEFPYGAKKKKKSEPIKQLILMRLFSIKNILAESGYPRIFTAIIKKLNLNSLYSTNECFHRK